MSLKGKTLFITGASRGIGLAIGLRAARDGANIVIAAKTSQPHPKLAGTIHSAAEQIEAAGGRALPVVVDVRDEASVRAAIDAAVDRFGGIDICVNNASAISLTGTLETDMKRYDLMHQVNARGTFLVSRLCIPHLRAAVNPHVLALCPPLDLRPEWFAAHPAYTASKYGMSLYMMAMAAEFRDEGIAFNGLWPRTTIATAAVKFAPGGAELMDRSRTPEILADAAHAIFCRPAQSATGQFYLDDEVLYAEGITDFSGYSRNTAAELAVDLFVDPAAPAPPGVRVGMP
ncbi:SDR family oxidoreductase [Peristeroidobacter soli]|uniref:SDR family oxidoreductase n=1 Tax=Peristeroidobacter soli TaxID=2497877 RepID=UPI00101CEFD6|nr:NAD(P)-dependent oxidoreductase [Peristeroidobacter soli]